MAAKQPLLNFQLSFDELDNVLSDVLKRVTDHDKDLRALKAFNVATVSESVAIDTLHQKLATLIVRCAGTNENVMMANQEVGIGTHPMFTALAHWFGERDVNKLPPLPERCDSQCVPQPTVTDVNQTLYTIHCQQANLTFQLNQLLHVSRDACRYYTNATQQQQQVRTPTQRLESQYHRVHSLAVILLSRMQYPDHSNFCNQSNQVFEKEQASFAELRHTLEDMNNIYEVRLPDVPPQEAVSQATVQECYGVSNQHASSLSELYGLIASLHNFFTSGSSEGSAAASTTTTTSTTKRKGHGTSPVPPPPQRRELIPTDAPPATLKLNNDSPATKKWLERMQLCVQNVNTYLAQLIAALVGLVQHEHHQLSTPGEPIPSTTTTTSIPTTPATTSDGEAPPTPAVVAAVDPKTHQPPTAVLGAITSTQFVTACKTLLDDWSGLPSRFSSLLQPDPDYITTASTKSSTNGVTAGNTTQSTQRTLEEQSQNLKQYQLTVIAFSVLLLGLQNKVDESLLLCSFNMSVDFDSAMSLSSSGGRQKELKKIIKLTEQQLIANMTTFKAHRKIKSHDVGLHSLLNMWNAFKIEINHRDDARRADVNDVNNFVTDLQSRVQHLETQLAESLQNKKRGESNNSSRRSSNTSDGGRVRSAARTRASSAGRASDRPTSGQRPPTSGSSNHTNTPTPLSPSAIEISDMVDDEPPALYAKMEAQLEKATKRISALEAEVAASVGNRKLPEGDVVAAGAVVSKSHMDDKMGNRMQFLEDDLFSCRAAVKQLELKMGNQGKQPVGSNSKVEGSAGSGPNSEQFRSLLVKTGQLGNDSSELFNLVGDINTKITENGNKLMQLQAELDTVKNGALLNTMKVGRRVSSHTNKITLDKKEAKDKAPNNKKPPTAVVEKDREREPQQQQQPNPTQLKPDETSAEHKVLTTADVEGIVEPFQGQLNLLQNQITHVQSTMLNNVLDLSTRLNKVNNSSLVSRRSSHAHIQEVAHQSELLVFKHGVDEKILQLSTRLNDMATKLADASGTDAKFKRTNDVVDELNTQLQQLKDDVVAMQLQHDVTTSLANKQSGSPPANTTNLDLASLSGSFNGDEPAGSLIHKIDKRITHLHKQLMNKTNNWDNKEVLINRVSREVAVLQQSVGYLTERVSVLQSNEGPRSEGAETSQQQEGRINIFMDEINNLKQQIDTETYRNRSIQLQMQQLQLQQSMLASKEDERGPGGSPLGVGGGGDAGWVDDEMHALKAQLSQFTALNANKNSQIDTIIDKIQNRLKQQDTRVQLLVSQLGHMNDQLHSHLTTNDSIPNNATTSNHTTEHDDNNNSKQQNAPTSSETLSRPNSNKDSDTLNDSNGNSNSNTVDSNSRLNSMEGLVSHLVSDIKLLTHSLKNKADNKKMDVRLYQIEDKLASKANRRELQVLIEQFSSASPGAAGGVMSIGNQRGGKQDGSPPPDSDELVAAVNNHAQQIASLNKEKVNGRELASFWTELSEQLAVLAQTKPDAEVVARKAETEYVDICVEKVRREVLRSIDSSCGQVMETLEKSLQIVRDMIGTKADTIDLKNLIQSAKAKAHAHDSQNMELAADGLVGYRCLGCNKVMEGMRTKPTGMQFSGFSTRMYSKQIGMNMNANKHQTQQQLPQLHNSPTRTSKTPPLPQIGYVE